MRPLPTLLAIALVALALAPIATAAPAQPPVDMNVGLPSGTVQCGGVICNMINNICYGIDGRNCVT